MLEFSSYNGIVTGSEIWSETHIHGSLYVDSVTSNGFGHVSGGGGSGRIQSNVRNMRRVYFEIGDGVTYNFVTISDFVALDGHKISVYGARRTGSDAIYLFFHAKNLNTGQYTDFLEPSVFAASKPPSSVAVMLGVLFMFIGLFAAAITGFAVGNAGLAIVIVGIVVVVMLLIRNVRRTHEKELALLSAEMKAYVKGSSGQ